jgi:hypothetical protein
VWHWREGENRKMTYGFRRCEFPFRTTSTPPRPAAAMTEFCRPRSSPTTLILIYTPFCCFFSLNNETRRWSFFLPMSRREFFSTATVQLPTYRVRVCTTAPHSDERALRATRTCTYHAILQRPILIRFILACHRPIVYQLVSKEAFRFFGAHSVQYEIYLREYDVSKNEEFGLLDSKESKLTVENREIADRQIASTTTTTTIIIQQKKTFNNTCSE